MAESNLQMRQLEKFKLDVEIFHRTYEEIRESSTSGFGGFGGIIGEIFQKLAFSRSVLQCSRAQFSSLELTDALSLPESQKSKGTYIILHTLLQPQWIDNRLFTLVEDQEGNVVTFLLWNYLLPKDEEFFLNALPGGSIFILKEPQIRMYKDAFYALMCFSPTDVMMAGLSSKLYDIVKYIEWEVSPETVPKYDMSKSAEKWKKEGNDFFAQKMFSQALESYLIAMNMVKKPADNHLVLVLYLNLSATYLALEYFEAALSHALLAEKLEPTNEKALYRAGRAYYELRQYREASNMFTKMASANPDSTEASLELNRCVKRLREEKGQFDFNKFAKCNAANPSDDIDCSDYIGPVRIVHIPGKGRRIVASRNIEAGTLLLVSKALSIFTGDPDEIKFPGPDDESYLCVMHKLKFATQLLHLCMKNPKTFGKKIYELRYARSTEEDAKRIDGFIGNFDAAEPIADANLMEEILDNISTGFDVAEENWQVTIQRLFHMPSFLHHSCMFNAYYQVYCNIMVVHSVRDIKRDEEVTISLWDEIEGEPCTLSIKKNCVCTLCQLDKKESPAVVEERSSLYKRYKTIAPALDGPFSKQNVKNLRKVIKDIENTYRKSRRTKLQVSLFRPYASLAFAGLLGGSNVDRKQMSEAANKALSAVGLDQRTLLQCTKKDREGISFPENVFVSSQLSVLAMVFMEIYLHEGNDEKVGAWKDIQYKLQKMFTGETAKNKLVDALFSLGL